MRGARALAIAIGALGAIACGRSEKKPPPAPAAQPKAIPRPTRVPAFVTLAELTPTHPVLARARVVAPLALDESGKQALATVCVVGADAEVATKAIADQYEAGGWKPPTRQPSAFAADHAISDGALHVQGQIRTAAACNADELAVELAYTKLVMLER